jgi:glycosyltransferase involved in cell wall biosynthesis
MTPTVSVITATYNYGRFLAGALDSVLRQTFQDFEVVVVDDGSTDDTPAVVRRYLADPRVSYQRTDHVGQPAAKNAGIRLARAPLLAFLDADDLWLPGKLERQVALFRRRPRLGVAYTRRLLMDEDGYDLEYPQPPLFRGRVLAELVRGNFVCFSSCMVRRRVLDRVGVFDEALPLAIDYDLWLRIARRYAFDYVDAPLVRYRVGHASLSQRRVERLRTEVRILKRHAAALPPCLVRAKLANIYSDVALFLREESRPRALPWYARALAAQPWHGPAWLGLGSLLLPEWGRRLVRRALGKAVDWRVIPRAACPEPRGGPAADRLPALIPGPAAVSVAQVTSLSPPDLLAACRTPAGRGTRP